MPIYNVGYDPTDTVVSLNEAFFDTTLPLNGGGSLTIDVDAFVRNTSPNIPSYAARLTTGAWTVTINGLLEQTGAPNGYALTLEGFSSTVRSTVTIGENGVVRAGTFGIYAEHGTTISLTHATSYLEASDQAIFLFGASSTVTNKGYIANSSGNSVIEFFGGGIHTVTNYGRIESGVPFDGVAIESLAATKTTITNQVNASISGQTVLGGGNDVINNSGYMGALQLGGGNNTVTNLGGASFIDSNSTGLAISGGTGNDIIANAGDIAGYLNLGNGDNRITGAGRIFSSALVPLITLGGGNDTISFTGLIDGDIELGSGKNSVSVSQVIGDITGGSDNDTVVVSKSAGAISLGNGVNSISGAGTVTSITVGDGNDTISLTGSVLGPLNLGGGKNVASVGQSGAIMGGSGNDTVSATKLVTGSVDLGQGINSFTAASNVQGSITFGDLADTLNVKGTVLGNIKLGHGTNTVTVAEVQGNLTGGNDNDVITITKLLTGNVDLGGGKNSLKGAGSISATTITFGNDDDVLALTGIVTGAVTLGSSVVRNTATIVELQGKLTGGIGNDTVTVSRLINGDIDLLGGTNSLTGAGAVTGEIKLGDGDDTLALTGKITGDVDLGDGLKNTASITEMQGSLLGGSGNDIVTLSKLITGGVSLGNGNNSLTGLGGVTLSVIFGDGDDVLSLAGTIGGSVDLGKAITKNTATVGNVGFTLFGGENNDIVAVNGIVADGVYLGDGADKLTLGALGEIPFTVINRNFLGAGNDEFVGNALTNIISDADGTDKYTFLGGDDTFKATGATLDGTDTVDGGLGIDTYDASSAGVTAVYINLSPTPAPFTDILLNSTPLGGSIAASKATGAEIGADTVLFFENAFGGGGNDVIVGTTGSNYLAGGSGGDTLFGLAGNDFIEGGADKDHIVGGLGADFLWGSYYLNTDGATDTFYYRSISESTVSPTGRDLIGDFKSTEDKLDFSTIDAITSTTTVNDDFKFLGKDALFTAAGDMRYVHTKGNIATPMGFQPYVGDITILSADVNGDRKADFSIAFIGHIIIDPGDILG